MARRVREARVRHRLVALLGQPGRESPSWVDTCSAEFRAGYVEGLRVARLTIRKG